MILITGATGTNGRELVKQLSDKGVKIRVMVRKRENANLPPSSNIEYVIGMRSKRLGQPNLRDFAEINK